MPTVANDSIIETFNEGDIISFSGSYLISDRFYYQIYNMDDRYYTTNISCRRIYVIDEQFDIENKNPFLWFIERIIN